MHYGNNFLFLRIYLFITPTTPQFMFGDYTNDYDLKCTKKAEPFLTSLSSLQPFMCFVTS